MSPVLPVRRHATVSSDLPSRACSSSVSACACVRRVPGWLPLDPAAGSSVFDFLASSAFLLAPFTSSSSSSRIPRAGRRAYSRMVACRRSHTGRLGRRGFAAHLGAASHQLLAALFLAFSHQRRSFATRVLAALDYVAGVRDTPRSTSHFVRHLLRHGSVAVLRCRRPLESGRGRPVRAVGAAGRRRVCSCMCADRGHRRALISGC